MYLIIMFNLIPFETEPVNQLKYFVIAAKYIPIVLSLDFIQKFLFIEWNKYFFWRTVKKSHQEPTSYLYSRDTDTL